MAKKSKKRSKRLRNLAFICTLSTLIFGVSTYAWFIGMRTVSVSPFDVKIAATDSLSLSLDGKTWSDTISISETTYNPALYTTNTNSWGGRGLIPVSSVGDIDTDASRLKLFEKASLTATPGGYRLMTSRVNNYEEGKTEQEGYVAFDLFIRNYSGTQYLDAYNILDEEAIYLTNNSEVKVATGGVENTGIENSVRVAFAQIGRVEGTTDFNDEDGLAKIQGISCHMGEDGKQAVVDGVTGICRTAQIWEPNDTAHVDGAINWYTTSCLKRTGTDVTKAESFSGACGQVVDGLAYPTYAIKTAITSGNNVDVYDGAAYNGYAGSAAYLNAFDCFTDTEKLIAGKERPTFMTLAPNSITKVRVYIYIEGQDIDNYDFASIGKKISVNFGFTKERYNEDDINYEGPITNEEDGPFIETGANTYVSATDKTKPFITLASDTYEIENDTITLTVSEDEDDVFDYDAIEATAYDKLSVYAEEEDEDGNKTYTVTTTTDNELTEATINKEGTVDIHAVGTYQVVYSVKDAAGNLGTKVLTVVVEEAEEPAGA